MSTPPEDHAARPTVSPRRIGGWYVLYAPEFEARFVALADEVERLKARLPDAGYRQHATVKLFAAVFRLVREIVPADPNHPDFRLHGDLAKFRRAKERGLPPRYRLFWVFSETRETIVFLYLNDERTLRKAGAKTDPYAVFRRMVARDEIGSDFETNFRRWQASPSPRPRGNRR